ncbi:MAG TPA: hypothetical protein VHB69_12135 [Mycobacteriales bacterium]|nr:hypothetical protein [Mycobacteriales bacterium]
MLLLVVLAVAGIVGLAAYCMVCERIEANCMAAAIEPEATAAPATESAPTPDYAPAYFAPVHYATTRAPSSVVRPV